MRQAFLDQVLSVLKDRETIFWIRIIKVILRLVETLPRSEMCLDDEQSREERLSDLRDRSYSADLPFSNL